jgi:hypothetical protein
VSLNLILQDIKSVDRAKIGKEAYPGIAINHATTNLNPFNATFVFGVVAGITKQLII